MDLKRVSYCKIHPGIGIARVGNSPDEFFLGPEAPGIVPRPTGGMYKDPEGRVKRQAARFRVYAYAKDGSVLGELTAEHADIEWRVELANTKAAWYQFVDRWHFKKKLRNPSVKGRARNRLMIKPSPRTISHESGGSVAFDDGMFLNTKVPLGEIRVDHEGRLIVLGGFGQGLSPAGKAITDSFNNDGWYDDVSDGPVRATVRMKYNQKAVRRVDSAHVVVGPPDFAPHAQNIVTLYDVMRDVAIKANLLDTPAECDFERDILSMFKRVSAVTWLSAIAARGHRPSTQVGTDSVYGSNARAGDFMDRVADLGDPSERTQPFRRAIFERLRYPDNPPRHQLNPFYMPQLFGDYAAPLSDTTWTPFGSEHAWLSLTTTQYRLFERWAAGDFKKFDPHKTSRPLELDRIPIDEQPDALDRAGIESCVGGGFHPGIEMTYVVRDPRLYTEAFRFKPLEAGTITRWMAVPWHADFYDCGDQWWPAVRPEQVVTEEIYEEALAEYKRGRSTTRFAAMVTARDEWDRGLDQVDESAFFNQKASDPVRLSQASFTMSWNQMGFVVRRAGPGSGRDELLIETERDPHAPVSLRDAFHRLLNIDEYPDFVVDARRIAEKYLAEARDFQLRAFKAGMPEYEPLAPPGTNVTFAMLQTRLDEIYKEWEQVANAYVPAADVHFPDLDSVRYRTLQLAPFNQLDGAWLQSMVQAGPLDDVRARIFQIWSDESGNGQPELNHANIYTELLNSVGLYLPDVRSEEYAQYPGFLPQAFVIPVFELAMSQFPRVYFPELLGMTLNIEWEVLSLHKAEKLLSYFGLNPHFYTIHIGIDNAAQGHSALALQAIKLYIDSLSDEGADDALRRIWDGYVGFGTMGGIHDLINKYAAGRPRPYSPKDLRNQVLTLIQNKAAFGQFNHGNIRLGSPTDEMGSNFINDLFEDTEAFARTLEKSGLFVPGDPDNSPFFDKIGPNGPMYKVFSSDEEALLREWVSVMDKPESPVTKPDYGELMIDAIRYLRRQAVGQSMHQLVKLTYDGQGRKVTRSVADWLSQDDPIAFLRALRRPSNQLIYPGRVELTRFFDRLSLSSPMGQVWNDTAPNSGERTWREVAIEWVRAGCQLPRDTAKSKSDIEKDKQNYSLTGLESRLGYRDFRPFGMGMAH